MSAVLRLVGIGLVAGVFSSLFGVGGGIVIVPLLLLATALRTHEATAVSLGAVLVTSTAGALFYGFRGELRPWDALLVGAPAVGGAIVGTHVQERLSGRALTLAFAGLLVAISIWLLVA